MASVPLLIEDDFERICASTQLNSFNASPVNQAFTAVAQEVVELLKQAHPLRNDRINRTETTTSGWSETVMIRALEPEYRQAIAIEPLTTRELEVLQLIVEGHNNPTIAGKLHITKGTVKTHVRNVLKKLYVSDRTQAAIRALRSGLAR